MSFRNLEKMAKRSLKKDFKLVSFDDSAGENTLRCES